MSHHLKLSHYEACFYGGALGDIIGFKNGDWEFLKDTKEILSQCKKLGGILKLPIDQWILSDDTVMHMATARALLEWSGSDKSMRVDDTSLKRAFCDEYLECLNDMIGRAPGMATLRARTSMIKRKYVNYDSKSGGNGAAMRMMAVGLLMPHKWQKRSMIRMAVIASLVTHHHPTAVLGAVVSALFTSYAIKNIPVIHWPFMFLYEDLPVIEDCLNDMKLMDEWSKHHDSIDYFVNMWKKYIRLRFGEIHQFDDHSSNTTKILLPEPEWADDWEHRYELRDDFARAFRYSDWYGSSGHDAVILAYDALLYTVEHSDMQNHSYAPYVRLMTLAALNEGDSDSIASIAGAWFGAAYGMTHLPDSTCQLEYQPDMEVLAERLFHVSQSFAE